MGSSEYTGTDLESCWIAGTQTVSVEVGAHKMEMFTTLLSKSCFQSLDADS